MDILHSLLSSVDSLCKQIGPRQNVPPDLDPNYNVFDTDGISDFFLCDFDLILYVPVNNILVTSGRVFLG